MKRIILLSVACWLCYAAIAYANEESTQSNPHSEFEVNEGDEEQSNNNTTTPQLPAQPPKSIPSQAVITKDNDQDETIEQLLQNDKLSGFKELPVTELIYLDKISARKRLIKLELNKPFTLDKITFTTKKCLHRKDHVKTTTLSLLKIEENNQLIFQGWLSKEFPSVNQVNNRYFNILLADCTDKK